MQHRLVLLLLAAALCCTHTVYAAFSKPSTNPANAQITENSAVGTIVTVDGDSAADNLRVTGLGGGAKTWTITSTPCNTIFQVQVDSGNNDRATLRVLDSSALNFEVAPNTYTCTITASNGVTTETLTLTVSVLNVMDEAPSFTAASYSCAIDEELATNTQLPAGCQATYVDNEVDTTGDTVTCSLSGTHASYFNVETVAPSKQCRMRQKIRLDYEAIGISTLSVNVEATDSGGNKATRPVTITLNDINDNPPVCPANTLGASKSETAIGEIVGSLGCTDRDSGANGNIVYSLMDASLSSHFAVDGASGRITNTAALDYDTATTSTYSSVIIKVADSGSPALSTSVTVTISIVAENDNTPAWGTFTPAWTSATAPITALDESAAAGIPAFTAQATDADFGPDGVLQYSIQSVRGSDLSNLMTAFQINPTSGVVSLATAGVLNREAITYADVTVLANDNPTTGTKLTITRVVRVSINDVNEFPPAFTPASGVFTTSIPEATAVNTVVFSLPVVDPDASAAAVTCSIVGGNAANLFKVNTADTKQIQANLLIEPDRPTAHPVLSVLSVACTDGGLTSTATVTVSVTLTNDNAPTITLPAGNTITVPENQALGKIADITPNDNDAGADGTYTCTVTPTGMFTIPGACDQLMLASTLDRETAASHVITLTIQDNGSPSQSATVSVTVSVTDVNDNTPVCTPSTYFATFAETSGAIASIASLTCSDADTHGIRYSTNTTGFTVSATTGVVSYTGGADYDTGPSSYDVIVYAIDQDDANKFAEARVRVTITNVNEHTPTFTDKTHTVQETVNGGQLVTNFVAADADKAPDSIQTYRILSGDASNYFTINNNGDLFVQSGRTLDYETLKAAGTTTWNLVIEAKDGGSTPLSGTGTLSIVLTDANDNAPVFSQSIYTATVAEGTATAAGVVTVAATDADADPTNNHAVVRYSFSPTNTYFTVNPTTGAVDKTAANLNYDTDPSVSITVLAIDNAGAGPNTATATVAITVTDTNTAPTCSLTTHTVNNQREDTALGTTVYSLTTPTAICSDPDTSQTLTYSLATGSDARFTAHPTTGALVLIAPLNYEAATSHTVTMLAVDSHATPLTATVTVIINVVDVNEFAPNCTAPTSASLEENAAISTTVYTVASCSDADTSSTSFTYSVVGGVPFTVSTAGVLTNSATLDYETAASTYVVQVTVVDNAPSLGGLKTTTYTTTVTLLPLNDNAPAFSTPATIYSDVAENTAAGTNLVLTLAAGGAGGAATIAATDADTGNSSHSTIIYSITSGNANGWFRIDAATGVLSVATTAIDRETLASTTLVVSAVDQAGTAAASSVNAIVTITDVNDNAPVFPTAQFTRNVSEGNTPPNVVVDFSGTAVTDADAGANAAITLSIQSGVLAPPNNQFVISGRELRTAKTFDLPTDASQFVLTIVATDGGLPQLTGTATVTVNIVEVNKVAPSFASGSDTISVPESTAIGATLYNVTATDTDVGMGGTITYSLGSVSPTGTYFDVSSTSGLVVLKNSLDYDTMPTKVYTLRIVATDSGTPAKSNTFTLTISITDANDNDPVFTSTNNFTKSFAENRGTGFLVTKVDWTDADTGAGGTVTCSIVSQTAPAIFTVNPSNCEITTTANPDREERSVRTVDILLTDGGGRTKSRVFTFTITDENDNAPNFTVPSIVTSVAEDAAVGTTITTVLATDADEGTNAVFAYSLISNDGAGDHGNFSINSGTGVITTALALDREQKAFFSLRVLAIDTGDTPLTGTSVVNVTVTDINDNTPVWVSAPYTATVSEGASIDTLVKQVTATDRDSTFGVLTYSIISGDTLGLFRINSATGRVETAKSSGLDRESVGQWNLTLRVQDNGTPVPRSAETELRVTVTDINEFAPAWVNSSYTFSIIENSPVGSPVGAVVATDNDAGPLNNKINYAIDAFIQGGTYFSIDPATAAINVSVAALDRETLDTHILRVVAWDSATPSKTSTNCLTVTISITDANDNDPVFSAAYFNATVAENAAIGFNVLTVTASDADIGNNSRIQYSIHNDAAGTLADTYFNMNANTGLLTVGTALDYETHTFYHFRILARDYGTTPQRTGTASVFILVTDVNDVAPTLSSTFYNAEVPQVDDGNMQIVTISATDPDTGSGGVVTYEWNTNTPYFYIDSTTGIVTRNTLNGVESYRIYTQDVIARDSGTPQLTSAAAKVRIDTFPAESYIVLIHFSMSEADYLAQLGTIKTNLASTLTGKYPNARVGQWKYHQYGSNIVGYFYALANTLTDNITYISVDKEYVPYSDLLAYWRFNADGLPTAILRGSSFTSTPIVKVEPYPQAAATPWYRTWWGILLLTLASLAAAALLAAACYGLYVCIKALCAPKPQSLPVSNPVKPPPISERQVLQLNKEKHPKHCPKPRNRYLIKESQGQNRPAQQQAPNNRSTTPKADFDNKGNSRGDDGRISPTDSFSGDANLDY